MNTLDLALSPEIVKLAPDEWHSILGGFEDASIFQTAAFCSAKSGSAGLEQFILRSADEVVAAAQMRVFRTPIVGSCMAYTLWGPMWKRQGSEEDPQVLQQALQFLRQEYVVRRKISLRINPRITADESPEYLAMFRDEGYQHVESANAKHTIVIDLRRSLEELRKGLDQKWRNQLNRAEKNGLEIIEGADGAMFELFLKTYREMLARKRLAEPGDIRSFMAMQCSLPERHKMKVFVCLDKGEPCAGAICSAIGKRGIFLFGATADSGTKNKASYLVQWRVVEWLHKRNCTEYDLHGVNAKSNPGVYLFKTGLCGKNGKEVEILEDFDAFGSRGAALFWRFAETVDEHRKKWRNVYEKYRGFTG